MCRSSSPLDVSPSSSKAALLGSVHTTPGVAGPRTPAEWWVLRAWVCLDQGLKFSSEDEEKVYGTLPWECLLLFEAPVLVAALISGKDYFISSCSFLSLFLSHFPSTRVLWGSLRRSSPCPCSFTPLISNFPLSEYTQPSFFYYHHPHSLLCFLFCTPLSFSFSLSPLFYPSNTWQTV